MGVLWSKSGSVEFDNDGVVAPGAKAYFFSGGTTTPAATYSDAAESSARTHPVVADANGRWPNVFIPYQTSYDVQVTTSTGTQLYYPTQIPNADPVEAAGDTVDDTQLLQTGDVIWTPKTGTRSGFVRLNGLTIGSATSGATERANADCEDLFTFYWNSMANAQVAVSGGRGASAAADWAANKTVTLLNGRSAALIGLDDMGNSAAGLLPISGVFLNGNSTTVGSVLGENTHTMTEAEIKGHTHTFSATTDSNGAHTHTGTISAGSAHSHTGSTNNHLHTYDFPDFETVGISYQAGGSTFNVRQYKNTNSSNNTGQTSAAFTTDNESTHTHTLTVDSGGSHTHTVAGTSGSTGSATAFNTVQRSILGTHYQKL